MIMREKRPAVLVVEDDPPILQGLLDVLVFNGFDATGSDDGKKGLEAALAFEHDLVLLDVMLPGLDGFSVCREIRRHKPFQPVILLTAKGAEEDVVEGFTAGADDYVCKPFSIRELMVRIEAVLRRSGRIRGREVVDIGPVTLDSGALTATNGDRSVELTRRELDIVLHLFRSRERIVSRRELLAEVWGYPDADIETRTVDIHILKLRKKLAEIIGDRRLISTVRGEGYRLEEGA